MPHIYGDKRVTISVLAYYSIPQFGGDEELLSLCYSLLEALLEGFANEQFIPVGTVNVLIACPQGSLHSIIHLWRV